MKNDQRTQLETQAYKDISHAKRQVDLLRDRLLMRGDEASVLEAYRKAQRDYETKWQALLGLTFPTA